MLAQNDLIKLAKKIHLRYIPDSIPGIKRSKYGKGFKYIDPNGVTISNLNTIQRINELSIPPAWKNVWISPYPQGHLQATGVDNKERKQYIYHEDWKQLCSEDKFHKLIDFAKGLPDLRNFIYANLSPNNLSRKKVLSTIIWLLEKTFIRIGNDEYAKDNNSFGLTTLRNRHVQVKGPNIKFQFIGKSGIEHLVNISHPSIAKTIKKCVELPGYELFKCIDEDGSKHIIDSQDVNDFLQEITGREITAKDFRTWGGTVLAATHLNRLGQFLDEAAHKNNIAQTVKEVSKHLRNTPSVCKKYYIHPTIFYTYSKKILVPHFQRKSTKKLNRFSVSENKVLTLLQKHA